MSIKNRVLKNIIYKIVVVFYYFNYQLNKRFKKKSSAKKILIGCLQFNEYTGSELYVFELAKKLVQENWEVFIVAKTVGNPLRKKIKKIGANVYKLKYCPVFLKFDILHCQHKPITEKLIELFPNTPKVCTIHSEIIELENPVVHHSIKKYIAVRPEIKTKLIETDCIKEDAIEIIYNPIDDSRFNSTQSVHSDYTLFVGTLDKLRQNAIFDLVSYTKKENKQLWVVGKNHSNYLDELKSNQHVHYFEETEEVEKYVINCNETAGIKLGRTTIEGWFCGKPCWIYDVDSNGSILKKELTYPPNNLNTYRSHTVIKQIIHLYLNAIKK